MGAAGDGRGDHWAAGVGVLAGSAGLGGPMGAGSSVGSAGGDGIFERAVDALVAGRRRSGGSLGNWERNDMI